MNFDHIQVDLEVTNRCNADCYFCPRDATPHQGLMTEEIFERSVERTVELQAELAERTPYDVEVSLCGLGEPLLNRHIPTFVRRVREAGFPCSVSSNGGILDERRAEALLDAGLTRIDLNIGEIGDDYENVYKLPWDKTYRNVMRFIELARGRCQVQIVLVDHRRNENHIRNMMRFWTQRGVEDFFRLNVINRGGALFVDHMQYEAYPEIDEAWTTLDAQREPAVCDWPFIYLFVGYDGQYYLCCSDWEKEVPLGSVFDKSFHDVLAAKLDAVRERAAVCRTCNADPMNRLTEELRAEHQGERVFIGSKELAETIRNESRAALELVESLEPGLTDGLQAPAPPHRAPRLIPVTAR